jgi:NPCBM/NEW2 domain
MARRCLIAAVASGLVFTAEANASAVKITATAVSGWVVTGSPARITGTVAPHPAGVRLTLQQRQGTGWISLATGGLGAGGTFSFRARPAKNGLATYRVVAAKDTSFTGSSAEVKVRVLHWAYLGSIEQFQYVNPIVGDLSLEPIVVHGVHYDHPVTMDAGCFNGYDGSAWVDFPLERRYEQFTATMDLGGSATTGSTATYNLVGGDGKKLASGSLAFGDAPKKIKASVTGEYRLRLVINVPDPTGASGCGTSYTQVVFGDAQLLGP